MLAELLLAAAQFAFPITSAYAIQKKEDVVVMVNYEAAIPWEVCVEAFDLNDKEMLQATDKHCWIPKNLIGDFDTWKAQSINDANFQVTVRYPNGKVVVIKLTSPLNS